MLAIGAEWAASNDVGYFVSDSRYQLETLDRGEIYVNAHGNTALDGLVHIHAKFETIAPKYLWLNDTCYRNPAAHETGIHGGHVAGSIIQLYSMMNCI